VGNRDVGPDHESLLESLKLLISSFIGFIDKLYCLLKRTSEINCAYPDSGSRIVYSMNHKARRKKDGRNFRLYGFSRPNHESLQENLKLLISSFIGSPISIIVFWTDLWNCAYPDSGSLLCIWKSLCADLNVPPMNDNIRGLSHLYHLLLVMYSKRGGAVGEKDGTLIPRSLILFRFLAPCDRLPIVYPMVPKGTRAAQVHINRISTSCSCLSPKLRSDLTTV